MKLVIFNDHAHHCYRNKRRKNSHTLRNYALKLLVIILKNKQYLKNFSPKIIKLPQFINLLRFEERKQFSFDFVQQILANKTLPHFYKIIFQCRKNVIFLQIVVKY